MSNKIKIGDCCKIDGSIMVAESEAHKICMNMDGDSIVGLHTWDQEDLFTQCEAAMFAENAIATLHLPIGNDEKRYGGKWFDLIRGEVKKEEYREIEGWNRKFANCPIIWGVSRRSAFDMWLRSLPDQFGGIELSFKDRMMGENQRLWKVLHLTNGCGHDKPQLWAHIENISIGRGNPEWGAPVDRDVFIIHLGPVFHTKNLKP